MTQDKALRAQLADFLGWQQAHAGFDDVVKGVPAKKRGAVPKGFAHSIWEIVEHMRVAQADILDFCVNKHYEEKKWPDDYWPSSRSPRSAAMWTRALADFRRDLKATQRLIVNP